MATWFHTHLCLNPSAESGTGKAAWARALEPAATRLSFLSLTGCHRSPLLAQSLALTRPANDEHGSWPTVEVCQQCWRVTAICLFAAMHSAGDGLSACLSREVSLVWEGLWRHIASSS